MSIAAAKKELQGTNTAANFGDNYIIAEAMINTVLYAREDYKGTGKPGSVHYSSYAESDASGKRH